MKKQRKVKIGRAEVIDVVNQIPFTAFFGCTFIKKDGQVRKINCNRSISTGLKEQRKPSLVRTSMVQVYDVNVKNQDGTKGGFRKVNLDTLSELTFNGKKYIVQ